MATSGEEIINSYTTVDSESNSELFCSPCQSDGKRLSSVGYCETCKASLCGRCFDCHTVPVPMRKHRLFKREEPLVQSEDNRDKSQCPKHGGETVLYHCSLHSFFGCHTCFFQHQKTCRESQYIPDLSETINSSDEFKTFMEKQEHTAQISKNLVDESKHNIALVEQCYADAVAAIKAFKKELLETIDQIEKDLYDKAKTFTQNEISKFNPVVDLCQQVQTDIQGIATEIEVLQNKNQNSDLYISMVKSKSKLLSLETELNATKDQNVAKLFKFSASEKLRETLKSPFVLGKLRITPDVFTAKHIKNINVKRQDDKQTCNITGSVFLPEHKLVIADYQNDTVKVIDTKQEKVLSAMTLSAWPWSLAKVTDNTVAATLPSKKKIMFIRTEPALSIDIEIDVDGACRGVAYSNRKLIVSFYSPHKIEIIDVKGSVLRRIQTDGNGQTLFNNPLYVAINPEHSLIYVSNCSSHNLVCLRFDGTVVATYKDNELQYPRQVIVDSTGNVYVCGYGSKNVHQMTEDCKKIKVLLASADGLSDPYTISYEETEDKLYVGQWGEMLKCTRFPMGICRVHLLSDK